MFKRAESDADYQAFGALCRNYVDWCRDRYSDIPWLVEEVFGYQALDAELDQLSKKYGAPQGLTLLAYDGAILLGGGAFQRFGDGVCELKRVFVTDEAKGRGVGRKLTVALIDEARAAGCHTMLLDTGDRLTEARALYESLGFAYVDPYRVYPERLLPFLVFMEKRIA